MEHLSEAELKKLLEQAATQVSVGSGYRHYKGNTYLVTGLAILEAASEVGVIYRAQYGANLTFVRALSSWVEQVEYQGQMVPRFQKQ